MGFFIAHRVVGDDEPDPPLDRLDALLDEVDEDPSDIEHTGVAVVHDSGWTIGVYTGWLVVYENVDDLEVKPRHLELGTDRPRVLRLMRAAAEGDLRTLDAQPWCPGYRPQGGLP